MRKAGRTSDAGQRAQTRYSLLHRDSHVQPWVQDRTRWEQNEMLERLSPQQVRLTDLGGEQIQTILSHAPGNGAPIGGLKVIAESGWFAARPSGTENIYKIYAESFRGQDYLRRILDEAQTIVNDALTAVKPPGNGLREEHE